MRIKVAKEIERRTDRDIRAEIDIVRRWKATDATREIRTVGMDEQPPRTNLEQPPRIKPLHKSTFHTKMKFGFSFTPR